MYAWLIAMAVLLPVMAAPGDLARGWADIAHSRKLRAWAAVLVAGLVAFYVPVQYTMVHMMTYFLAGMLIVLKPVCLIQGFIAMLFVGMIGFHLGYLAAHNLDNEMGYMIPRMGVAWLQIGSLLLWGLVDAGKNALWYWWPDRFHPPVVEHNQ